MNERPGTVAKDDGLFFGGVPQDPEFVMVRESRDTAKRALGQKLDLGGGSKILQSNIRFLSRHGRDIGRKWVLEITLIQGKPLRPAVGRELRDGVGQTHALAGGRYPHRFVRFT